MYAIAAYRRAASSQPPLPDGLQRSWLRGRFQKVSCALGSLIVFGILCIFCMAWGALAFVRLAGELEELRAKPPECAVAGGAGERCAQPRRSSSLLDWSNSFRNGSCATSLNPRRL